MSDVATRVWRPLGELPADGAIAHVNIRTPDGAVNSWRWLAYRRGSQTPFIGGRWQQANEYGFRNAALPRVGEWTPNPLINPRTPHS